MLEDDSEAVGSLDDLVHDAFLQEGKAAFPRGFTAEENEDRTTGFIVCVVCRDVKKRS
jgi:hypothetical protein